MKAKKKTKAKVKAKAKPKKRPAAKRAPKKAAVVVKGSGCAFCDLNLDPFYTELSKGVGGFAHQTKAGPVKCTNPAKQEFPKSDKVYFPKDKIPSKPGIYRTSRTDIAHYGSAYSWWTGDKWTKYKDWGGYHESFNFVWCGTGPDHLSPFAKV